MALCFAFPAAFEMPCFWSWLASFSAPAASEARMPSPVMLLLSGRGFSGFAAGPDCSIFTLVNVIICVLLPPGCRISSSTLLPTGPRMSGATWRAQRRHVSERGRAAGSCGHADSTPGKTARYWWGGACLLGRHALHDNAVDRDEAVVLVDLAARRGRTAGVDVDEFEDRVLVRPQQCADTSDLGLCHFGPQRNAWFVHMGSDTNLLPIPHRRFVEVEEENMVAVEGAPAKRAKRDDGFTLAGHDGGVKPDGGAPDAAYVLKVKQAGKKGEREEGFLRSAIAHPFLSRFVPHYVETRRDGDQDWLVLENVMAGMRRPSGLDLKMGTRTYGDDATPEKIAEQTEKAQSSTTSTLGIRVVGCRRPAPDGSRGDELEGSKYKKEPADENEMRRALRRFLPSPGLLLQARMAAADLEYWFSRQSDWVFFGSSLFFAFDTAGNVDEAALRVKMIDFAHAHCVSGSYRQDNSYLDGLRALQRCLCDLPAIPATPADVPTIEWACACLRHALLQREEAGGVASGGGGGGDGGGGSGGVSSSSGGGGGGGGCVVFLRHGQTGDAADSSIEQDLARTLTEHGRLQVVPAIYEIT
jgi:uncharacterized membrane protein YgcG